MRRWFKLFYWRFYLWKTLEDFVMDQLGDTPLAYPLVRMVELEAKEKFLAMDWRPFVDWFNARIAEGIANFNAPRANAYRIICTAKLNYG